MIFEISIIIISLIFLLIFSKLFKDSWKVYMITFIGALIFQYFTQALWLNQGLEPWAYLYLDVSWILTLGWATIIMVSRKTILLYAKNISQKLLFLYNLIVITIIAFFAEWIVTGLGIREYSPAVVNTISGITLGPLPIEALFYIPTFIALILTFTMYWEKQFSIKSEFIWEDLK